MGGHDLATDSSPSVSKDSQWNSFGEFLGTALFCLVFLVSGFHCPECGTQIDACFVDLDQ